MVAVASRGEKLLFKVSTLMVLTKLLVVICLGGIMIQHWNLANIGVFPDLGFLIKNTIAMLPVTLTSILFIPSISPMVISYRSHNKSIFVARYKAMRAMKIAFCVLFITVFSYAMSFNLAMGHDQAVMAYTQNVSALAIVARGFDGSAVKIFSLILNIFAVMTAFFSVFLGFREACQGIAMNLLQRFIPKDKIDKKYVRMGILIFAVAVAWGAIVLNAPVLKLLTLLGPIFGLIACLIPAYLVYKVKGLHQYKGVSLVLIVFAGILLIISPILAFL
jgi:amino acid permease